MHQRLEKYLMGARFAGIEVEFRGDETVFHVAKLKRKGNKLAIEKVFNEIKSIEELPLKVLKDIPTSIVITGKGVLYRQIQADQDSSPDILLRKILPNVKANDFFVSSILNDSGHFVSLARKSVVEPVYTELKKHCSVVSLNVGSQGIRDIRSLISVDHALFCGHHTVKFDVNTISAVEYNHENKEGGLDVFTIGEQPIAGHTLLAFAAGFRLACGNYASLENDSRGEFVQRKMFRTTLRAAIVFVFTALSLNYFMFSHYWNLQQELESKAGSEGSTISEMNTLREQVQARSRFLQDAGLLNNSSFAWYADQLAHNMPDGIQLSRMNFSPRLKLAEEDTVGFQTSAIEISGNCEESITLNRWIQFLQDENWISSASIRSYEQDKAEATGKFILDLQLH